MIATVIRFLISNYSLTFFILGLVAALLTIARLGRDSTRLRRREAFVACYCLFAIGLLYVFNFIMHVFFAPLSAKFIGWPNSPFQYEVGFASLGFGVIGLLAFRRDFGLRLAAVLGPACFLWGAAGGHIYQMVAHHNFSPGNAGVVLWTDLLLPLAGIFFLTRWRRAWAEEEQR
jgi:uncharacterized protein DUF6790